MAQGMKAQNLLRGGYGFYVPLKVNVTQRVPGLSQRTVLARKTFRRHQSFLSDVVGLRCSLLAELFLSDDTGQCNLP